MNIEGLLDKMRQVAPALAEAKANVTYLTEFRKSKKAILYQQAPDGTIAERESWAYSHPEYLEVLEGLKAAVADYEMLKHRMEVAKLRVELWRTEQANLRSERQAYGS